MLVPLKPVLDAARKGGYAQGAFNVNAVCQAKAVIEAHETLRSAAILQGADFANAFMGGRADFANGTVKDKIAGAKNIGDAVKKYGEDSKVAIRNVRREAMDSIKAMKKKSEITEDEQKTAEKDLQKVTDDYIKKVDDRAAKKEKELMEL